MSMYQISDETEFRKYFLLLALKMEQLLKTSMLSDEPVLYSKEGITMPDEIKTIPQEETTEKKSPAHLPILTVEKDEEPLLSENDQEKAWHELKNAYITKRILIGGLIGMEVTPNDNRTVGITYYNGQKVITPQTGDNSNTMAAIISIICLVTAAGIFLTRRSRKKDEED